MQIVVDYLRKDLGKPNLVGWEEIRQAYLDRAALLLKHDWQSPAYLSSIENQAGRRLGTIVGNINDYTRDKHDLALVYERKFAKEYLPRTGILPLEPFVTSSGMAALTTIIAMLHRLHGASQTVLVGKHSYFQNLELLYGSFAKVVLFDETNATSWQKLIEVESPIAVFVDSLCNVDALTVPPVDMIAKYLSAKSKNKTYLVVDNSMLSIGFPWRDILKYRSRKLDIVGWESLNKYYQFGMDRVTGGIVWGYGKLGLELFNARLHSGTIMSDIQVAMLPTPSRAILLRYLARIEENRCYLQGVIGERALCASTNYSFSGAQVVVRFPKKQSYQSIQRVIKKMIGRAKNEGVQLSAGTSFGFPTTRVYLTARATKYAQMFLRISVGVEEVDKFKKVTKVIVDSLG